MTVVTIITTITAPTVIRIHCGLLPAITHVQQVSHIYVNEASPWLPGRALHDYVVTPACGFSTLLNSFMFNFVLLTR